MSTTPENPSNSPLRGPEDDVDPQLAPRVRDDRTAVRPSQDPAPTSPSAAVTTRTRAATTWVGLVVGLVVLILLLVFILQNLGKVSVKILAWQLDFPLGITVLLSAIAGALVMALAGGVRIVQIRRAAKRGR